jgi:DNA-binding HxlR family transcriptional regulator
MPKADAGEKPRQQWAPDARALSVVGDKWRMVIVRDLAPGPLRLEMLRTWLPGVSSGALQKRLLELEAAGLLDRRRTRQRPPRVDLELTPEGHTLAGVIGELARWELRTCWSAPQEHEWVDVAACFRLAPFLVEPARAGGDGELALVVLDEAGATAEQWAFVRERGRAKVEHRPAPDAQARLAGTQDAWVRALSPRGSRERLEIDGRARLAAAFLDLFATAPA